MRLWAVYKTGWFGRKQFIGLVEAPDYTLALGVASRAGLLSTKRSELTKVRSYEEHQLKRLMRA